MPPLLRSADYSWDLSEQFVWSFVEVNAGIVCASLAALKPLFMRYLPVLIVSRLRPSQDRSTPSDAAATKESGVGGGGVGAAARGTAASSLATGSGGGSGGPGYEMASRDDLPPGGGGRDDDEEAQLWARKHGGQARLTSSVGSADSRDSIDGLSDLYPGARPPTYAVSGGGFDVPSPRSPDGVRVTKETHVAYGK